MGLLKQTDMIFKVFDFVDILSCGSSDKKGPLPLSGVLGMMADTKYSEMQSAFEQEDHRQLAEVKRQGVEAVKAWIRNSGGKKYRIVSVSKETAMKILTGEIRTYEEFYSEQLVSGDVQILYRVQNEMIFIETFFIAY